MLGLRILVVDDDRDTADTLSVLLKKLGHETRGCYDGTSAVEEAQNFRPQLVLLDLAMPDISGMQLVTKLRGLADLRDTPIVAVTGYPDAEHRERAIMAGFDAF